MSNLKLCGIGQDKRKSAELPSFFVKKLPESAHTADEEAKEGDNMIMG